MKNLVEEICHKKQHNLKISARKLTLKRGEKKLTQKAKNNSENKENNPPSLLEADSILLPNLKKT